MKRHVIAPRADWPERVESQGLLFHSTPVEYWDESAFYEFSAAQIDILEKAANDVHQLCLNAVAHLMGLDAFPDAFQILDPWMPYIRESWERHEPYLYGRFDFAYDGYSAPKLLEYNADTPTSLLEAAVIQWHWLEDTNPNADQFNSVHERLIDGWKTRATDFEAGLYFASVTDSVEDQITVQYMRDTAMQAGLKTEYLPIDQVGWDFKRNCFVDMRGAPIRHLFKLYPWEWLMREKFGPHILKRSTSWLEPPWKMLLSNKAILAVLWELFPGHPNLLRAELQPFSTTYIRKPCLGREGSNIEIVHDGRQLLETGGRYGSPYVFQDVFPLPEFDGNFPVLGCWMVEDKACGMGIRESTELVTQNTSRFVPHLFPSANSGFTLDNP